MFSWQLSLIIFVGLPLIIYPVIILTKKVKKISRAQQKNQEGFTAMLLDFLSGIHTVKIYTMEAFSLRRFNEQNNQMAHLECKSAKYALLTRPILHTITTFSLATVVLCGLHFFHLSIAELIVFCGLLHLFYEPVKKFAEETANIQRGIVAAERMFEVLNLAPSIEDHDGAVQLKTLKDELAFQNVWFRYEDRWIIKDLSFTVGRGQTVAIVGPTGAGKSTIVQLIPRLYEPQKGKILIDGIELETFTQKSLRERISFVPQKPFLFFDTVAKNISFGKDFTRQEIERAAKAAHAHEFIMQLPKGYDTKLVETGKNLSGGQQQRLAIARALIKKGEILIFDEATSSLDAISELQIKQTLYELKGKVTQILIAHRFSTIEHADKIIYLDDGKKIAEGTKEYLLETCEPFQRMWKSAQLKN